MKDKKQMNILTLNYEYPPIGGGAATRSKDIAEALVKKGHNVTLITMRYKDLPKYEKVRGVEIYRLPCLRTKASVCHPWEQLTYIFAAIRFLRKFLRQNSIDVCNTHFIIPSGVIALWVKNHFAIPYIISSHGSDVPGYNNRRFKLLHKLLLPSWKRLCRNANNIVAPSAYLGDLISNSLQSIKCEIIPFGIDINVYKNGPKENIILAMSRLQEHKGIQHLIHTFAQIPHSGWAVHIAGDGPYRSELEALIKHLNLTDSVVFHGWLENKSKEHIELLAKAKIFVSASDFESFGVSAVEAIVSDCCVILSDIAAHKYFERFGAHFFSKEDVNALAEILHREMETPVAPSPIKEQLSINYALDKYEGVLTAASYN